LHHPKRTKSSFNQKAWHVELLVLPRNLTDFWISIFWDFKVPNNSIECFLRFFEKQFFFLCWLWIKFLQTLKLRRILHALVKRTWRMNFWSYWKTKRFDFLNQCLEYLRCLRSLCVQLRLELVYLSWKWLTNFCSARVVVMIEYYDRFH
jgi:hypothetical protein